MRRAWRRLLHLLRPSRAAGLREEIAFHLERKQAEEGLSPAAAERAFGNDLALRERSRDAWGWLWLESLGRDLRLALRLLRRAPGFAIVAILTLALGIGCNLAVFTLVETTVLRALPVAHPEQLLQLDWTANHWSPGRTWGSRFNDSQGRLVNTVFSDAQFQAWNAAGGAIAGALAFRPISELNIRRAQPGAGAATAAAGELVSGNYAQLLGLQPALGRLLGPGDTAANAPAVAMLSYGYWQSQFGGARGVVGETILINRTPVVVVGVAPAGFDGLELGRPPDLFLPLSQHDLDIVQGVIGQNTNGSDDQQSRLSNDRFWFLEVVARRRHGASIAQARAQLAVSFATRAAAIPQSKRHVPGDNPVLLAARAASGVNNMGAGISLPLELLAALTGLILLIVCINLANLLLARAAARRHEIAVRIAIGAGRAALLRQLLAEAFVLAGVGALFSLPLALAAGRALQRFVLPPHAGRPAQLDLSMVAAGAALAVLAALLMGALPAWQATRSEAPARRLRQPRWGAGLIAAQIALCLAVVTGAGLFGRTLRSLQTVPTGLDARGVVLFDLNPQLAGYENARLATFTRQVLERLRALPGVESASASSDIPGAHNSDGTNDVSLIPNPAPNSTPETHYNVVSPGFFSTYHMRLLAGRGFSAADAATAPLVAVVNQAMAARFHGIPVGQKLYWRQDDGSVQVLTVVGEAADSVYNGVRAAATPVLYIPVAQQPAQADALIFQVRSALPPGTLAPALRAAVARVDPDVPLSRLITQDAAMALSYQSQTTMAMLALPLAALALLLAAIGLYGLLAFSVARRTREIGIRLALGATRGRVLAMIVRQALLLAAIGAACGLPLAWLVGRAASSMLFGVGSTDAPTWAGAVVLLLVVAAAAALVPARRAASVDAAVALRQE